MSHNNNNGVYGRASLVQKAKGPKWKRELVSDHKFDFIDVEEFRNYTCLSTIRYFILLCSVLISFATYGADIWSAGILLIYDHWSLSTQPKIPFYISKWIYVGCIALSFMLVAWEIRKTRSIMESRDISLAVTNPLAYRTYSVRSYSHFCLLQKIKNSTKWSDVIIFYVFYTLKGWKKVIIAQGPRQIIAGITVYALLKSAWTDSNGSFKFSSDWNTYGQDWPQRVALMLMSFTCILWIMTALQIVLAILLYFPVLCHIQGNLKEYCCHKIDKRIDELLEKQRKKRLREQGKKYAHSINSNKKSKKSIKKGSNGKDGGVELGPVPALPTLPVINNVDLYAGEKTNMPPPPPQWLYQQPQHQSSFNNYYDNQPMAPLESNYSLQRSTNNKYNPYTDDSPPYISQPQGAYHVLQDNAAAATTGNYYYPNQQYSNINGTISTPAAGSSLQNNKPNAYDEDIPSHQITNHASSSSGGGNINYYSNNSNSNANNIPTYNNNSSSNVNTYNTTIDVTDNYYKAPVIAPASNNIASYTSSSCHQEQQHEMEEEPSSGHHNNNNNNNSENENNNVGDYHLQDQYHQQQQLSNYDYNYQQDDNYDYYSQSTATTTTKKASSAAASSAATSYYSSDNYASNQKQQQGAVVEQYQTYSSTNYI